MDPVVTEVCFIDGVVPKPLRIEHIYQRPDFEQLSPTVEFHDGIILHLGGGTRGIRIGIGRRQFFNGNFLSRDTKVGPIYRRK